MGKGPPAPEEVHTDPQPVRLPSFSCVLVVTIEGHLQVLIVYDVVIVATRSGVSEVVLVLVPVKGPFRQVRKSL